MTAHAYGRGRAYYVAFCPGRDFIADFVDKLAADAGLESDAPCELPQGVIARKRGGLTYLMNFTETAQTLHFDRAYTNHLTGETVQDPALPPFGYPIIEL